MRILKMLLLAAALGVASTGASASAADDCPEGMLTFNFDNLQVRMAFAQVAEFAGLRPNIDQGITVSAPIRFTCLPWRVAARNLADKYNLNLKIENDVMSVSRKN